jgi:uncharacterized surface protein with fasciclin (FAS1) repeats
MLKVPAALAAAVVALAVAAAPAVAKQPAHKAAATSPTIVDTVVALSGASGFDDAHGDFDILREAVLATGLDGALAGKGQFTVFAPTDQAFLDLTGAASEADAFAAVAGLGLDTVATVLKYHVVRGARTADEVVPATRLRTLSREFITKDAGSATLVDATGREVGIAAPDAAVVSNGVIHVIDGVLLPVAL